MGFIDSYKHLEKLCGEILQDNRRVSAYIDEMLNTPNGSRLANGWDDDLRKLKHYRWVRNQISHEPGCSEANMCEPEDAQWLDNFYLRIMNQTDPLALYVQATKPRPEQKPKPTIASHTYPNQAQKTEESDNTAIGFWALLIIALLLIAVIIFIAK